MHSLLFLTLCSLYHTLFYIFTFAKILITFHFLALIIIDSAKFFILVKYHNITLSTFTLILIRLHVQISVSFLSNPHSLQYHLQTNEKNQTFFFFYSPNLPFLTYLLLISLTTLFINILSNYSEITQPFLNPHSLQYPLTPLFSLTHP